MFPGLGLLFWLALGIAATILGPLLLVRGVQRRSWRGSLGGIALPGCLVSYAIWSNATHVDQWNPTHARPEALLGTWKAGDSRLEFFRDGTFRIDARGGAARRVHLTRAHGRWELDNWNLTLRSERGSAHELRVVVSNGSYRIIEQPGDLDGWMPWRGFSRSPSSPAPDCAACE